jgi:hypothetical protein
MKNCRTSLFLLACIALLCSAAVAGNEPAETLASSGRIDGAVYKNNYLGMEYFVPENWVARVTPAKLPGSGNDYLLLTLKRKHGEQLSSVMVSSAELNGYGGDLQRYLEKRYRRHDGSDDSADATINGISIGKSKRADPDPQLLMISGRSFYRVDTESGAITRVAIATEQHHCALVFELIVPTNVAEKAVTEFVESLYALTFTSAPASR